MAETKKTTTFTVLLLVFLLIIGGIGYVFWKDVSSDEAASQVTEAAQNAATELEEGVTQLVDESQRTLPDAQQLLESDAPVPSYETTAPAPNFNLDDLLEERAIGNPNAPLTVYEHSSLTCGHCGAFHKTAYKQIKADYIDTGKVYLVFSDFPLNGPAVHASMIARCVPEYRYFDFVQLLFERQDDWAYKADYLTYLKQNAQLAGLNEAGFDACIGNEALQQGLMTRMQEVQETQQVRSTPTFVINGDTVLSGARPYDHFAKVFEAELAKINLRPTPLEIAPDASPDAMPNNMPDAITE